MHLDPGISWCQVSLTFSLVRSPGILNVARDLAPAALERTLVASNPGGRGGYPSDAQREERKSREEM